MPPNARKGNHVPNWGATTPIVQVRPDTSLEAWGWASYWSSAAASITRERVSGAT